MTIRLPILAGALALAFLPAGAALAAQAAAPRTAEGKVMTPQDIVAVASAARAANPSAPMVSANLASAPPYRVNVEHRIAGAPPSVHVRNAELFTVVDGEGVFTLGGELVDPQPRGNNIAGTAIRGGQARAVTRGDVVFVPAGVPHMVDQVKSPLTLVATHLPNVAE